MWARLLRQHRHRVVGRKPRVAVIIIQWCCAWHLFTEHVGGLRTLSGPSMLPTLNNTDDIVVEDCLSRRLRTTHVARGDLVSFLSPIHPGKTVCKRVIGLPGDTVCVDPTKPRHESARDDEGRRNPWHPDHVIVPKGHIWVAGDNSAASRDSRTYGPIPISLVRGRIIARLYPEPKWFGNNIVYID